MEGIRRVLELSGKWGPEGTELTDADKYIDLLPGQVWPVRAARTSAAAQETGASQGSRGERGFVATRVGAGGSLRRAALYPAELRVPRASHVAHRGRRFNARAGVEWPCRDLEAIGDSASMLQRQNVCAKSPAAELTGSNPVRCARADGVPGCNLFRAARTTELEASPGSEIQPVPYPQAILGLLCQDDMFP
jgi:hypothetical protein